MKRLRGGTRRRRAGLLRGWRRNGAGGLDHGQSLVEFAITLPILLAMLVAIFEFGRAWNINQVITNAAREGAREAVVGTGNGAVVQNTIDRYLSSAGIDPTDATVVLDIDNNSGEEEAVTINYPYEFGFMGGIVRLISGGSFDGTITLSSTSIMRDE